MASFCKDCGRFFANSEIMHWDTKWEARQGEDSLVELIAECPHCGKTHAYRIPADVTFSFD